MATIVTGEQYVELDGKLHEIKRQIRQPNGYPNDPADLNRALQAIVEGRFEFRDAERTKYLFDSESVVGNLVTLVSRGWRIIEHVGQTLEVIGVLEAVPFLKDEGSLHMVSGEEMMRRAIALKATLGFLDAVFALRHGAEIPEEMRKESSEITFPGTVLVTPDRIANVACLRWIDPMWHFVWRELTGAWWEHDRVARLKTAA